MSTPPHCHHPLDVLQDGDLVVLRTGHPFTLEPGHRMRSASCAACDWKIGGLPVLIIGVAALAGFACHCGGVVSDTAFLHAACQPASQEGLRRVISRIISCGHEHPWPDPPD